MEGKLVQELTEHEKLLWHLRIEAGKTLSIPRGPKTGEGAYQHVHVREGTIEFWMRAATGDWTGEALVFGSREPMRITGLRVASVSRERELRQGILSPAPDAHTLYWQHRETNP